MNTVLIILGTALVVFAVVVAIVSVVWRAASKKNGPVDAMYYDRLRRNNYNSHERHDDF